MNVLMCLATILFILMILIGGKKGARSFIALFFNFSVIFFTTLIMLDPNVDPVILTLIASIVISCINLFYINEVNSKTIIAFISTIITTAILLLFIVIVTENAMIQGFGEEEIEELSMFSLYIGVDFVKIGTSVIITNTLFFAFFGGYLALLIWFKDLSYSVGEIVNSKIFGAEVITILYAGIGVTIVIPIASWITAYHLVKTREKNETL
jgi:uncharacterized membrane protein